MLTIAAEKLAYIVAKAREFDAEVPVDPDAAAGSDAPDDDERQILLDTPDNPSEEELRDAIDGLNVDEREELLALMWLGRGDFDAAEWASALRQARDTGSADATRYLVEAPLLADHLEEAASALGISLAGLEGG